MKPSALPCLILIIATFGCSAKKSGSLAAGAATAPKASTQAAAEATKPLPGYVTSNSLYCKGVENSVTYVISGTEWATDAVDLPNAALSEKEEVEFSRSDVTGPALKVTLCGTVAHETEIRNVSATTPGSGVKSLSWNMEGQSGGAQLILNDGTTVKMVCSGLWGSTDYNDDASPYICPESQPRPSAK